MLFFGKTDSTGVKLELNGILICQFMLCYDLHVDKGAQQNRFTSDFSAFSKKSSHLQIALISKHFEPQKWELSGTKDNSMRFKNLLYFFTFD